jgi:hypothetical protein
MSIGDSYELFTNGINRGSYSVTQPTYDRLTITNAQVDGQNVSLSYYLDKAIGDFISSPYTLIAHANISSTTLMSYPYTTESASCDTWIMVYANRNNNNTSIQLAKHSPYTVDLKLDNKYLNLSNYYTKSEVDTAISNVSGGGGGGSVDVSGKLDTSAFTAYSGSVATNLSTNYYTKSEVDAAIPTIWTGTQAQYDAIQNKVATTIYIITS